MSRYYVELKYDLRLPLLEDSGRNAVGPQGDDGFEATLMRDYDGSLVVGLSAEYPDMLGALEVAQERSQGLLWDLTEDGVTIPAPVQVTIIDYERAVWLYVPEESKGKA